MIKMFLPILFNSARKWGYISQSGEIVFPPKFLCADSFSEGLAPVATEDGSGYINGAGCFAIPPLFGEAYSFEGGLAIVSDNNGSRGKYGMIDKSGKFVIKPAFDNLALPSSGLSLAAVDNKMGFLPFFRKSPFSRWGNELSSFEWKKHSSFNVGFLQLYRRVLSNQNLVNYILFLIQLLTLFVTEYGIMCGIEGI